jgi:hypothetical protein
MQDGGWLNQAFSAEHKPHTKVTCSNVIASELLVVHHIQHNHAMPPHPQLRSYLTRNYLGCMDIIWPPNDQSLSLGISTLGKTLVATFYCLWTRHCTPNQKPDSPPSPESKKSQHNTIFHHLQLFNTLGPCLPARL